MSTETQCVLPKKFLQRKKEPASADEDMLCFALQRFMLEIRNQNGGEYAPDALHHLVCGVLRHVKSSSELLIFFLNQMKNLQTSEVYYRAK